MDGAAIVQTFATCSGPDCLKSVISKFGFRVKVYTAIKAQLDSEVAKLVCCKCNLFLHSRRVWFQ